jgi:hypothetical protein
VNIHRPHLGTEAPYSAFGCLLYMITNIMWYKHVLSTSPSFLSHRVFFYLSKDDSLTLMWLKCRVPQGPFGKAFCPFRMTFFRNSTFWRIQQLVRIVFNLTLERAFFFLFFLQTFEQNLSNVYAGHLSNRKH